MIRCRAVESNELFVTAKGDILPCCFIYRGGPKLTPELQRIIDEENFDSLVKSWESSHPNKICFATCDEQQTHNPMNMANFDNQWMNNFEDTK
jgi:hypothetical protein